MAGYTIQSFGCRASAADSASLAAALAAQGLEPADQPGLAQVVVVNTCAVTAQAERDARAAIRRVRRESPQARIVVTGCYAQRAPGELAALHGVSAVVGNSHKAEVAALAAGLHRAGWVAAEALTAPRVLHAPFTAHGIAGEHTGEDWPGSLALAPAIAGRLTRGCCGCRRGAETAAPFV